MTTLISAIYGSYDKPKPLPPDHGFDRAVLVTDRPAFVEGWQVVVEPSDLPPRLAAKGPKCEPWRWVDDDASVWIDGAFEVAPGGFLREAVEKHLAGGDLVAWRHPSGRVDAYEEALFSAGYAKYLPIRDDLVAQAEDYRAAGLPAASGLWEVGMLARRHTDDVMRHGALWRSECHVHSVQDQVSFPFVTWRLGMTVTPWQAHSHWSCGWVRWHQHRDES